MRIGVLVGQTEKGDFEYLGKPGEIDDLDNMQRGLVDAGGVVKQGKGEKRYVKTWLVDATRNPLKAKKC